MARASARSRGRQVEHGALFQRAAENVVERLLLVQHGDQQLDRGAARRQADLRSRICALSRASLSWVIM